jgi:hypothetical protein
MAGVEGLGIRGIFARRDISGRTFGPVFDLVLLTYGVLPTTCLIVGIDFVGGSRLPANSGGRDRLKAKYGAGWPPRFGRRGCLGGRWIGREGIGGRGGGLVEVSLAQTGWDSEGKIVRL